MFQHLRILFTVFALSTILIQPAFSKENSEKPNSTNEESSSDSSDEPSIDKSLDLLKALDYPELQVVPRASQRLKVEAARETSGWYTDYWAFQVSGLATAYVGSMGSSMFRASLTADQQTDADAAVLGAQVTGAGWILGTVLLGLGKPYETGYREVRAVKGKDKRAQLLRERMAEETLESSSKLMTKLTYGALITNAMASIYLATFMNREGTIYAAASAMFSFLPMIFPHQHIVSWGKHQEYKRKIYVPFTSMRLHYDSKTQKTMPLLAMNWTF
ncbi:MAG: hypothetical protein H6626_00820 [Pseudobdellovibrionaceae bacterium]|nr:hypothetical protein [Bdellovibrionales bacterium]USN47666.1 MAG: hypothetical protein H6626_00820 [Pseudobdellovibrionaceae bacterium]